MTDNDPFAPRQQNFVIPTPGARAVPQGSPQPAAAPATPRAGFERVDLAALDWSAGLNPLVAAAAQREREWRKPVVVIGKDTRLSGYMIENALAAGICSMGVNVQLVGPLPTPGIAFITTSMRADAGVVISASHNPFMDNGIKFFDRQGFKLPDEVESEIAALVLCLLCAAVVAPA